MKPTPDPLEALEKNAAKRDGIVSEIKRLGELEPGLRDDLKGKIENLEGLEIDQLLCPAIESEKHDEPMASQLRSLHCTRTKLELLPGIQSRLQRDLKTLDDDLEKQIRACSRSLRAEARSKIEELRAKLHGELSKLYFGDATRIHEALPVVLNRSELIRWENTFATFPHGSHPGEAARNFIVWANKFRSGLACK